MSFFEWIIQAKSSFVNASIDDSQLSSLNKIRQKIGSLNATWA